MKFAGLYPIVHTPFDSHGEVDYDSLRRLVQHVRGAGADGLVFPGFASEWWRLTDEEVLECASLIGAPWNGSLIGAPFIGVVTPQATIPALGRAKEFERLGATALMLLPPFLLASAPGRHLSALLASTQLPCIVQDSAGLTGTRLDAAALANLAVAHGNLAGVKVDQVPTGPAITNLREHPALHGLSYFAGYSGVQWWDASRRGATALMGGCAHIPEDRAMLSDPASYHRLLPLLNFEMQSLDTVISVHKWLLFERGILATPELREPCLRLDATHLDELHQLAAALLS
jgi:4-hydroxy-tetrahydrodipicolinate synthase